MSGQEMPVPESDKATDTAAPGDALSDSVEPATDMEIARYQERAERGAVLASRRTLALIARVRKEEELAAYHARDRRAWADRSDELRAEVARMRPVVNMARYAVRHGEAPHALALAVRDYEAE